MNTSGVSENSKLLQFERKYSNCKKPMIYCIFTSCLLTGSVFMGSAALAFEFEPLCVYLNQDDSDYTEYDISPRCWWSAVTAITALVAGCCMCSFALAFCYRHRNPHWMATREVVTVHEHDTYTNGTYSGVEHTVGGYTPYKNEDRRLCFPCCYGTCDDDEAILYRNHV